MVFTDSSSKIGFELTIGCARTPGHGFLSTTVSKKFKVKHPEGREFSI